METYVDTLQGTGWIPNWPGTYSHGSRIIRNKEDGEIVDVLPPLAIEETDVQPEPEEEKSGQDEAPPPAPIAPVAEEAPSENIHQTEPLAQPEEVQPAEQEVPQTEDSQP